MPVRSAGNATTRRPAESPLQIATKLIEDIPRLSDGTQQELLAQRARSKNASGPILADYSQVLLLASFITGRGVVRTANEREVVLREQKLRGPYSAQSLFQKAIMDGHLEVKKDGDTPGFPLVIAASGIQRVGKMGQSIFPYVLPIVEHRLNSMQHEKRSRIMLDFLYDNAEEGEEPGHLRVSSDAAAMVRDGTLAARLNTGQASVFRQIGNLRNDGVLIEHQDPYIIDIPPAGQQLRNDAHFLFPEPVPGTHD